MVQDALRVATEGEAVPGYKGPPSSSSSSSSGQKQWWQEQFEAVFLPSIRWVGVARLHPDGPEGCCAGFLPI